MNTPDFGDIQDFILQFHLQLFNFRDVKFVIARGLVELVLIKFFLKVSEAASYHTFYENEKYETGFFIGTHFHLQLRGSRNYVAYFLIKFFIVYVFQL